MSLLAHVERVIDIDFDKVEGLREKFLEYGVPDQLIKDLDDLEGMVMELCIEADEVDGGNSQLFDNVLTQILNEEE